MQKLKYSLGLLVSICMSIGSLFKLMEWPGADYLLIVGLTGFSILFLPLLAYDRHQEREKSRTEKLTDILGFASAVISAIGIVFKIGHLTGGGFMVVGGAALFTFGFLPFLFLGMYKKSLQQKLQKQTFNG